MSGTVAGQLGIVRPGGAIVGGVLAPDVSVAGAIRFPGRPQLAIGRLGQRRIGIVAAMAGELCVGRPGSTVIGAGLIRLM